MKRKGVSYIELILAMGIMAIIVASVTITMGLVGRANVNKAADKAISKINEARAISLTKGSKKGSLAIICKNGNIYTLIGEGNNDGSYNLDDSRWQVLCKSPVKVRIDTNSEFLKEDDGPVVLKFKQSSGEVISGPSNIYFYNGNRKIGVKIESLTGKCHLVN